MSSPCRNPKVFIRPLLSCVFVAFLLVAGCSYESSGLDSVACDEGDPDACGASAECIDGYCVGPDDDLNHLQDTGPPEDVGPDDVSPLDIGPTDTDPGDVEPSDTEPDDTGPADTGPDDTGPVDTGPDDTGTECDEGEILCGDECVDTDSNPEHCGECDEPCSAPAHGTPMCVEGGCDFNCDDEHEKCGDQCVDTDSDTEHCGECDEACEPPANAAPICEEGACDFTCDGEREKCGEQCVDTNSNPDHCGECDEDCENGLVCSAGACEADCSGDETECSGACVNTNTSIDHCGDCGDPCDDNPANSQALCEAGACTYECNSDFEPCEGQCWAEEEFDDDVENCGECGNVCDDDDLPDNASPSCFDGGCSFECNDNFQECENECWADEDFEEDINNCGECGNVCDDGPDGADPICTDGGCTFECSEDHQPCEGECRSDEDFEDDVDNCGECERVCDDAPADSTPICTDGECDFVCDDGFEQCGEECIPDDEDCDFCDPDLTEEFGGGVGEADDPYLICNEEQLTLIGDDTDHLEAHFRLEADLDYEEDDDIVIPNDGSTFEGHFDGNGHTIDNLTSDSDADGMGLFAEIGPDGTVTGLHLTNVSITDGGERVSIMTPLNQGVIRGSSVHGEIQGEEIVGGLVAVNEGEIHSSTADVSVQGDGYVGGLVGRNENMIFQSQATGDVDSDSDNTGGLVGYATLDSNIDRSAAHGDVTTDGSNHVGGLVGLNRGNISDSYATGSVTESDDYVGGLVGRFHVNANHTSRTIENCYSSGLVDGEDDAGGLIGDTTDEASANSNADVENSFWDLETSGQETSDGGEGLETEEFSDDHPDFDDNFSSWNFDDTDGVWEISEAADGAQRPVLQWQLD